MSKSTSESLIVCLFEGEVRALSVLQVSGGETHGTIGSTSSHVNAHSRAAGAVGPHHPDLQRDQLLRERERQHHVRVECHRDLVAGRALHCRFELSREEIDNFRVVPELPSLPRLPRALFIGQVLGLDRRHLALAIRGMVAWHKIKMGSAIMIEIKKNHESTVAL